MKKLNRFITKKRLGTIRARILLSTISLVIIISTIITFISYFVVSSNLWQNLIQTSETKLSFLCSSINTNILNVNTFIRACQTSSKIKDFVLEEETDNNRKKREAHDYIIETYTSNAALPSQLIRVIVIGKSRNDIIQVVMESSYSTVSVTSDAVLSLPYFEVLHNNPGEISTGILQDPFINTKELPMIPFVYSIPHPYQLAEIGYIYTEMSLSVITVPIHNYLSQDDRRLFFHIGDEQYLYINDTLIPYPSYWESIEDLSDIALSEDTTIQKVRIADTEKTSIIITRPLAIEGWYVTECLDESVLNQNILRTFALIAMIILAAASMIGVLLSWFLSKTVNAPVRQLQSRIKRIEEGDFSRDLSTEWEHELGDIGKTINDLSENVLLLMNQKIEDERQKKDYEYRMLQSQINPHFLYNTLNSIKWMATIQNSPGIAEMTTSLSRLLKDISKGTTNLVSIKHELSLINDYFIIQQYRYGGAITLAIDIDDESLTSCQILKFTMQPIVENSIFHGIEPKGTTGNITIHIYQDTAQDIHIDITDDGIGMKPELAASLLEKESPAASSLFKEIGISNVHKRLQYEFGNKYGLSIVSEEGKFTTISILLPFRKSEEPYDKTNNSR